MSYGLTVTVAADSEPITLAEAKRAIRMDETITEYDDEIESLHIPAARRAIETLLDTRLITQTVKLTYDRFPCYWRGDGTIGTIRDRIIEMPIADVVSVGSVKYYDTDNALQTISAANYQLDASTRPARLMPVQGYSWPATYARLSAVEITVTAGASTAALDPLIKSTVLLQLRAMWEDNEQAMRPTIDRLLDLAWDGRRHATRQ
jgi:uncharacterized phiE125 gp8 family phage protein